jgi:recombination protein RecR
MDALSKLINALRCLPGIGPKSAQRMAYHLLQNNRAQGLHLAACLDAAMQQVQHCQRCNNYTSQALCKICQNQTRNTQLLCVVEGPADLAAIEQTGIYTGYYYVLMGRLSPLDGIGPKQLELHKLETTIKQNNIKELILALSPTIEGQTTVHFIQNMIKSIPMSPVITQPAQGIPSGGELEFLDSNTIGNALRNRATLYRENICSAQEQK